MAKVLPANAFRVAVRAAQKDMAQSVLSPQTRQFFQKLITVVEDHGFEDAVIDLLKSDAKGVPAPSHDD